MRSLAMALTSAALACAALAACGDVEEENVPPGSNTTASSSSSSGAAGTGAMGGSGGAGGIGGAGGERMP